ncbi:helix-turn-helix domain-containing protein [Phenylobacterium sp.]|uniref:helix-turn-helix domain-containing protein n=1 Tax=Phenylobacterium sp. TaxID=1871053 RepID=UPI0035AD8982
MRRHRLRLRLTQEDLAAETDLKRSYLSELENGRRNPTVRVLGRLADALGVEPAELLRRPSGG